MHSHSHLKPIQFT